MSSLPKPIPVQHPVPARSGNSYRVAIVGAGTLKGKEVAEILHDRNFPSADIKLLDDDDALGRLEEAGGEVTFIQSVRSEQFDRVDFTFFASDPASTRKYWKTARNAGSAIIDLSSALEDEPDAVVHAPWIERQRGLSWAPQLQPGPAVTAHPSAVVLALLLLRLQKAGAVARVATTVFEPASEHGQRGMDELHEQTVNLLSFQPLPKNVFDTQVAFNMVSHYGEHSAPSLASVQERIARHYQKVAGTDVLMPSLLLVQAPTFHGHTFSLHIEMEEEAGIETITKALAGEHVSISKTPDDSPSNVNAAGQNDVLVCVTPDSTRPNGFWLWAAADNLRVAACSAVECAETLAASRPRGKVQ